MYKAVIIDDEKWVIKSLIATIGDQSWFEISGEAYDGLSGLHLIQDTHPDLVFTDVCMAGMGGLDLLYNIHSSSPDTLFIIISGHAEFAYAQKALQYNAVGYCLKPFSKNEIHDMLEKSYLILQKRTENVPSTAISSTPEEAPRPQTNKKIQQMLEYLNAHYTDNITILDLAMLCNINPNYASQLFSQELNTTYSAYLTKLRINQAVHLLRTTDMPVSNIALTIGYRDYFYFAKVFKKNTGVTPSEYRSNASLQKESIL